MDMEIVKSGDGSTTIFVPELNEHYHSVNGAIQESQHVFINAGLHHIRKKHIQLLEIGFGTGLNALLTCMDLQHKDVELQYTTIEPFPLDSHILEQLNFTILLPLESEDFFQALHNARWGSKTRISDQFSITKFRSDIQSLEIKGQYDLVFFDAFGPDVQPELWESSVFHKLHKVMLPNAVLTTYSAKGQVRRNLEQAGLKVEKIAGPPGKREMIRARKPETPENI